MLLGHRPTSLFFILTLVGCGVHEHGKVHSHVQSDASEEGCGLELNGDLKWEMDQHTELIFARMSKRVEEFALESGDQRGLKELGTLLQNDLDALIVGCTMTGAAHNELHKFLEVYIPEVDTLGESGGVDSAKKISGLLKVYPLYFK